MKFEVKATKYLQDIQIYITVGVNDINPLEVEQDIEDMKEWLLSKYHKKEIKESWLDRLKRKLL